jgi:hypothetical protein
MHTPMFPRYADYIRSVTETELEREIAQPERLQIASTQDFRKRISIAYAPFDHVNLEAEVVIVGLTPGRQQTRNALFEARRRLKTGESDAAAMQGAKVFASFSGPMRSNLVDMLDDIGLSTHLGLSSTSALWSTESSRAHFTSVLRYPVLVDGQNYSGAPDILRTPLLREHLLRWFAAELAALPRAVFVPLGPKVARAVEFAAAEIGVEKSRILSGMPHPSGANAERIAFFLGRKPRSKLSSKVEPERLLAARRTILDRIASLGAPA